MTSDSLSQVERLVIAVGLAALSLPTEVAEHLDRRDRRNHRSFVRSLLAQQRGSS